MCNDAPQMVEIITNAVSTSGFMFFIDRPTSTENWQNNLELGLTFECRLTSERFNHRKPSSTVRTPKEDVVHFIWLYRKNTILILIVKFFEL